MEPPPLRVSAGQLFRLQQTIGNRAVLQLLARESTPPEPAPPSKPLSLAEVSQSERMPALQAAMNRAASDAIAAWVLGVSSLDGLHLESLIRFYGLDSATEPLTLERAVQLVQARVRSAIGEWCPVRIEEPAPPPAKRFLRCGRHNEG